MRVAYRQIARVLVRGLPLDDDEVAGKIEEYTRAIEAMPEEARFALQSAYIFSSKVPPKEREDLFQEIVYAVLRKKSKDDGSVAYITGRGKWLDGCSEHKNKRHHKKKHHPCSSLNEVSRYDDRGEPVEVGETIVETDDLEDKVIERVEAQRIYRELPRHIKLIVKKRFRGEPIGHRERQILFKFRQKLRQSDPDYQCQLTTPSECLIEGCEHPSFSRGYCRKHYARWYRTGSPMGLRRLSVNKAT